MLMDIEIKVNGVRVNLKIVGFGWVGLGRWRNWVE